MLYELITEIKLDENSKKNILEDIEDTIHNENKELFLVLFIRNLLNDLKEDFNYVSFNSKYVWWSGRDFYRTAKEVIQDYDLFVLSFDSIKEKYFNKTEFYNFFHNRMLKSRERHNFEYYSYDILGINDTTIDLYYEDFISNFEEDNKQYVYVDFFGHHKHRTSKFLMGYCYYNYENILNYIKETKTTELFCLS